MSKGLLVKGALAVTAACAVAPSIVQAQETSPGYSFLEAVKKRDATKVSDLISSPGTLVNAKESRTGNSALHFVSQDRDLTWLSFLLGKGARPDTQNNRGETALGIASQLGWAEGVELLLRVGAKVDLANSSGETPLILAVQRRQLPVVRLLLSHGADPRRTDTVAGYSALDYAKQDNRSAAIVRMLETPPAKLRETAGPKL